MRAHVCVCVLVCVSVCARARWCVVAKGGRGSARARVFVCV